MEKFIMLFRDESGVKYVNYQFDTAETATAFAQQKKYSDFLVVTQAEFEEYRSGIKQQQQQIFTSTTYQAPRTRVNIEEYEPDENDDLTFEWTWTEGSASVSASGPNPEDIMFPFGTTTVTLTVNDGKDSASDTVDITVVDTTPPVLTLLDHLVVLWSPNHKYVTIDPADIVLSATDICDGNVGIDDVVITSVSSDKPEDLKGPGDGSTLNDMVILNAQKVKLRAERNQYGNGKVYTINCQLTDLSGNSVTGCTKIWVPKSMGFPTAIDDGAFAGYTVYYP